MIHRDRRFPEMNDEWTPGKHCLEMAAASTAWPKRIFEGRRSGIRMLDLGNKALTRRSMKVYSYLDRMTMDRRRTADERQYLAPAGITS